MEKIYCKLAPKGQQHIRKHRVVFTSTKGLFRKQRWVMLDIDENGITYNSEPGHTGDMFGHILIKFKLSRKAAFTKNAEGLLKKYF